MRRMVGAAILVVGLGSATVSAWWSERKAAIHSSIAELATPTPDSISVVVPPAPATPIVSLADPLAFLSSAPPESLDLLPGVGPVLATRLVAARREQGPFRSWDDVDRVRGIGPKTIERLKNTAVRR